MFMHHKKQKPNEFWKIMTFRTTWLLIENMLCENVFLAKFDQKVITEI